MVTKPTDQYSEKEAKARFEAALKGALKTSPKPLKSVSPKLPKAETAKAKKKSR